MIGPLLLDMNFLTAQKGITRFLSANTVVFCQKCNNFICELPPFISIFIIDNHVIITGTLFGTSCPNYFIVIKISFHITVTNVFI